MSSSPMAPTTRSTLRRLPERGRHDWPAVAEILDAGFLAFVGFAVEQQPLVIPTLYGRDGETLYLHGSAASRMMRELSTGVSACVTVAVVDGIVLARSAFNHSMNYRSVVAFGTAKKIEDGDEKVSALKVISDHLLAGRWDDVRLPTPQELKATTVLKFVVEEASAKIRTGPPGDDEEDYALPVWAGVLPLALHSGAPEPDPRLRPDIPAPLYLPDGGRGFEPARKEPQGLDPS
jgi:nitroimidazol reductase NimA-like FMN-containing flavoprotein (pyridoxamine 5'-phosphate oxidase superfamily)